MAIRLKGPELDGHDPRIIQLVIKFRPVQVRCFDTIQTPTGVLLPYSGTLVTYFRSPWVTSPQITARRRRKARLQNTIKALRTVHRAKVLRSTRCSESGGLPNSRRQQGVGPYYLPMQFYCAGVRVSRPSEDRTVRLQTAGN